MSLIFEDRAYEAASLRGCFWAEDYPRSDLVWPQAKADFSAEVAIIGAGYTGLSAALHLAEQGIDVAVFDMHAPGWGASGRSGGFCCLGGAMASDSAIRARFGQDGLDEWDSAQENAVDLVAALMKRHAILADTHSDGETQLAHSPRAYRRLMQRAARDREKGNTINFIETQDLAEYGMSNASLLGGRTENVGFGLHPRKYVLGLAEAAKRAGAKIYSNSLVHGISRSSDGYELALPSVKVRAKKLILATNGYSRDDVPKWLKGRFMPVQSNIIVTRELTDAELQSQGWTSSQMVYDTRELLHYFRLLPDNRMMFGMRGGITATPNMDRKMHQLIRRDFEQMFPAWSHVETPWFWTGLVCLTRKHVPFVGAIPDMPNAFAGFGWHGNGIAIGTYAGKQLAAMASGQDAAIPTVMKGRPTRLPFGKRRRMILPPIYGALAVRDVIS
ncbi:MAG: FAD-dependent oxidoreductase [Paracoccaceae bacterium]|nr:FAD-dependent oxidoreductase [Paracoccaceae bacterium]MDG1738664.1 FAD-dependent oxidoreductase [Paracoccaceae bacterium]MDG2258094.1 FAD-dependent oxidoreductase [Paracoccaceae bacterium]